MFADDTNISFSGKTLTELENRMNNELVKVKAWLETNRLSLNVAKTEFMVVGSRQRLSTFDNHDMRVEISDKMIKKNVAWANSGGPQRLV